MSNGDGPGVKTALAHLCALGVAGYFLYAAYGKIINPRQFALLISYYKMVPEMYLNLMAIFMPWWEVGGALALIIPRTRPAGAIIVGGLLVVFIIAIAYAAFYLGLNIDCGCTGKGGSKIGWLKIAENTGMLIAIAASLYLPKWKRAPTAEPYGAKLATERAS
jgi:putative oxidoreductase